jgi:DNA-binding MarR family transcriptional regulator
MDTGPWLSGEQQDTWRIFLTVTKLLDAALDRELLRDAHMPHAYYGLLVALAEQEEGRRGLSDLASLVDFSQSRLTHALKRMESYGWVRREPRPDNGREKDAVLTAAGRAALVAAAPGHVALVRELMFDHLSAAQLAQLREICGALLPVRRTKDDADGPGPSECALTSEPVAPHGLPVCPHADGAARLSEAELADILEQLERAETTQAFMNLLRAGPLLVGPAVARP